MGMHNHTKFRMDSSIFRDFTVGDDLSPPLPRLNISLRQKTLAVVGLTLCSFSSFSLGEALPQVQLRFYFVF